MTLEQFVAYVHGQSRKRDVIMTAGYVAFLVGLTGWLGIWIALTIGGGMVVAAGIYGVVRN